MENELEQFDTALVDILMQQIMNDVDNYLREKLKQIINDKDPQALRKLIKDLSRI